MGDTPTNLSCCHCECVIYCISVIGLTSHALEVADAIEQLDLLVKARRTEINQSKDIKSHIGQPHARRVGECNDKPLPYPRKGDPIHLDLVDPIWLEEHPESASRWMILHWTKLEAEEAS